MLLAVLKLWMTGRDEVVAINAPLDQLRYAEMAQALIDGHWLGDYTQNTLIREPGYPLWLWALDTCGGIPARLGIEVLLAGSALVLALSLWRAGLPQWLALLSFVYVAFEPHSFALDTQLLSDTLYAPVLVLVIGTSIHLCLTAGSSKRFRLGVLLGGALAMLWHTRPESLLMVTYLGCLGIILWKRCRDKGCSVYQASHTLVLLFLTILAPVGAAALLIRSLNYLNYGTFVTNELLEPGFVAAQRALLQINVGSPRRYVAIPFAARELGYSVSPTLRRLQPTLETRLKPALAQAACESFSICDDIPTGWFVFALRDAAAVAGYHRSGALAARFYEQVAEELNDACRQGRVLCRWLPAPYFQVAWLREIPHSILSIAERIAHPDSERFQSEPEDLPLAAKATFDRVAHRRASLVPGGTFRLTGWVFDTRGAVSQVRLEGPDDRVLFTTEQFLPRPDVIEHFSRLGMVVPTNTGWTLSGTAPGHRLESCRLVFASADGGTVAVSPFGPPRVQPLLHYSIDEAVETAAARPRPPWLVATLRKSWPRILASLSLAGLVGAIVCIVLGIQLTVTAPRDVAFLLLFVAVASRFLFFTYVDVFLFPAPVRYFYPGVSLWLCILTWMIYRAGVILSVRLRSEAYDRVV